MTFTLSAFGKSRLASKLLPALVVLVALAGTVATHPLGNFTINHFTRLGVGPDRLEIRYVVEMAEISTHQELQAMAANHTGKPGNRPDAAGLDEYAGRAAAKYLSGLTLTIDGSPVDLRLVGQRASLKPGDGGMPTLRVECDLESSIPAGGSAQSRRLHFEDRNHEGRAGWHEAVVTPQAGTALFDSDSFANGLTDELQSYPADLLAAPLDERVIDMSFVQGSAPVGAKPLRARSGAVAAKTQDRFAALINVPELTPYLALLGLLFAFVFGGLHAMSPGHGKTVVGAYLVGSRGTAKHAAFLGLTVTITHTLGVFAVGLLTLFASKYVVPERLFPIISFASGAVVLGVGLSLFVRRLRGLLGGASTHKHDHDHTHDSAHGHTHDGQAHSHDGHTHSHGGRAHSHLPPGADGGAITWRSLLALGISGGLLPCPSALVVMLSAISLHRVGYGLVLIIAFSLGLASVLTGIGLAFIYARRFIKLPNGAGGLVRALPVVSA
ncbi:MAG: sulfite exporter TauE/SafE family protein, partial [Acidobacteriota bacterium]|nr:sulfite exporter TauE/SafE family protein [Acidobacteriota bacterium]